MDLDATALAVAVISFVGTTITFLLQQRTARKVREEERRLDAKGVLDRYRGPLLDAAADLAARIHNLREQEFATYADDPVRGVPAKLTTAFRFAQFLGWREVLRTEEQMLRFDDVEETRVVAELLNDARWALSTDSDTVAGTNAMLWVDEQRAIGELMVLREDGITRTLGFAGFVGAYEEAFAPWMDRFVDHVIANAAPKRLRLLQWTLYGLVRKLDEEGTYKRPKWMPETEKEITAADEPIGKLERRVLADVKPLLVPEPAEARP